MKKLLLSALVICVASMTLSTVSVHAQDNPELDLRISRDFGYSSGTGKIQGRFSMRVGGPENLQRVAFYIDDELVAEDNQPPFRYQFDTSAYMTGVHTLYAIGYTNDGEELRSNQFRQEFLTAEQGWGDAFKIVIPILVIVVGISLIGFLGSSLAFRIGKNRVPMGQPRNYGPLGGAICPHCGRPFKFHIYSISLIAGRLDHCHHCGKWSFLRRQSLATLRAAEAAELEDIEIDGAQVERSEEDKFKRDLDNSRYQDYL